MELTRKYGSNSIGQPKCKKPWKITSQRSATQIRYAPKSWEKKIDDKKKMKALKDRIKEAQVEKKAKSHAHFEKIREKAKLKEINTFKSAQYQVVRYFYFINDYDRLKTQPKLESGHLRQSNSLLSSQQRSSIRDTMLPISDSHTQSLINNLSLINITLTQYIISYTLQVLGTSTQIQFSSYYSYLSLPRFVSLVLLAYVVPRDSLLHQLYDLKLNLYTSIRILWSPTNMI